MPVDIVFPVAPIPFAASDGHTYLVYEAAITNLDSRGRSLTLTRVDVTDASNSSKPLAAFTGEDLKGMLLRPGLSDKASDPSVIADGMQARVWMWVSSPSPVPEALQHRFTFKVEGIEKEHFLDTAATKVDTRKPPVLGPAWRGGDWGAANGPSNTSSHRQSIVTIDGHPCIGQRFAIDWVKFNDQGKLFSGDGKKNEDYFGFGEDLLAVADAVVAATHDGIPENEPGSVRAVPIDLETVAGNYVVLDLGQGLYAGYAHLQPGSLRVKKGDRVRKGDVLGKLGNTGNSDAPHLHFEVMDAPNLIIAEGYPYLEEQFTVVGTTKDPYDTYQPDPHPTTHRREMPTENQVVRFP
jgi:murein DD-endopeptidase MepM/ murein hydrolase activator NlpD